MNSGDARCHRTVARNIVKTVVFDNGLAFLAAVMILWPAAGRADVDIPTPSWLETTTVAHKMVINGLPSRVRHFRADRRLDEVLGYYRRRWDESHAGRSGYREAAVEPWHVISRLQGRYLLTVQARRKDGFSSEGYLAVADLRDVHKKDDRDKSIPKMAGSHVVNDTTSYDPGKKGRTVMIVNDFSIDTNGHFYRDYYLDRGWGGFQDQGNGEARVLGFRRFGRQVRIVILPSAEGTVTVMNLVQTD